MVEEPGPRRSARGGGGRNQDTTMTTHTCENSLQTLMRWFFTALGAATVIGSLIVAVVIAAYLVVGAIGAVIIMAYGIIQSINADKRGEQPQVGRATLAIAVYLFGLPTVYLLAFLHWGTVDESILATWWNAEKILLMFTAYIVFVNLVPKLMRRSSTAVHRHTAVVMAVLMFPIYYHLLCKVGFFHLAYDWLFDYLDANYGIGAI